MDTAQHSTLVLFGSGDTVQSVYGAGAIHAVGDILILAGWAEGMPVEVYGCLAHETPMLPPELAYRGSPIVDSGDTAFTVYGFKAEHSAS